MYNETLIIFLDFKFSQEWTNLAESKEGYGPERAVLPMMMMILNFPSFNI
jgi:hypothetical protein